MADIQMHSSTYSGPKGIARIPLTKGLVAIVDECNLPIILRFQWRAHDTRREDVAYAIGHLHGTNSKEDCLMHRLILGLNKNDKKQCDHINGNTLDNRRSNLRTCSNAENCRNTKIRKNNTSGYKGVYFNKSARKWQAYITCTWKITYLGTFDKKEDAAMAYNEAARKFHGQFARLNSLPQPKITKMQFIITKQIAVESETPEDAVKNIGEGKTIALTVTPRPAQPQVHTANAPLPQGTPQARA